MGFCQELVDPPFKCGKRLVGRINKFHREPVSFKGIQRFGLERNPPFVGQVDLNRDSPAGRFFVEALNKAAAKVQVMNVDVDGEGPRTPAVKWPGKAGMLPS